MENVDSYVQLRVDRLTERDLHRKPNKWISQMPQGQTARRVLDIACGIGCESIAWTRAGKKVVGIDFNLNLLRAARDVAKGQGLQIDYVVADATRLPFCDASFDIASSEALLEHVPNWRAIGSEALRVLGDEGIFFVSTINRNCPINPEIQHLHFYPWLPQFLKAPVLRWVMRSRPAWVSYTKFPAINWFTHRGLARSLRQLGFTTYEVFDMARKETTSPSKRKFFFLIQLVKQQRYLRYFAYPLMGMVQILAVKRGVPREKASEPSAEPAFAK